MRVLVTGSCGLIGWKLTEQLLVQGHSVIGVDNLAAAYDVRLKNWRLDQLRKNPGFNFQAVDIGDSAVMDKIFEAAPQND
jgi:nucleoside-diphosphate-sugar epimerase